MTERLGLILLTGPPGIGKTTLVRKVCEDLTNIHKIACSGFYTEEVRNPINNERIGFDVVTLNKNRGILSRVNFTGGPFVGKYCVNVKDFENVVLPLLQPTTGQDILVIDEVGKMELKSKNFEMYVEKCIMKTVVLATVPYYLRQSLHLVDKLKNHPKSKIIVVTKSNRNSLQHEVTKELLKLIKNPI